MEPEKKSTDKISTDRINTCSTADGTLTSLPIINSASDQVTQKHTIKAVNSTTNSDDVEDEDKATSITGSSVLDIKGMSEDCVKGSFKTETLSKSDDKVQNQGVCETLDKLDSKNSAETVTLKKLNNCDGTSDITEIETLNQSCEQTKAGDSQNKVDDQNLDKVDKAEILHIVAEQQQIKPVVENVTEGNLDIQNTSEIETVNNLDCHFQTENTLVDSVKKQSAEVTLTETESQSSSSESEDVPKTGSINDKPSLGGKEVNSESQNSHSEKDALLFESVTDVPERKDSQADKIKNDQCADPVKLNTSERSESESAESSKPLTESENRTLGNKSVQIQSAAVVGFETEKADFEVQDINIPNKVNPGIKIVVTDYSDVSPEIKNNTSKTVDLQYSVLDEGKAATSKETHAFSDAGEGLPTSQNKESNILGTKSSEFQKKDPAKAERDTAQINCPGAVALGQTDKISVNSGITGLHSETISAEIKAKLRTKLIAPTKDNVCSETELKSRTIGTENKGHKANEKAAFKSVSTESISEQEKVKNQGAELSLAELLQSKPKDTVCTGLSNPCSNVICSHSSKTASEGEIQNVLEAGSQDVEIENVMSLASKQQITETQLETGLKKIEDPSAGSADDKGELHNDLSVSFEASTDHKIKNSDSERNLETVINKTSDSNENESQTKVETEQLTEEKPLSHVSTTEINPSCEEGSGKNLISERDALTFIETGIDGESGVSNNLDNMQPNIDQGSESNTSQDEISRNAAGETDQESRAETSHPENAESEEPCKTKSVSEDGSSKDIETAEKQDKDETVDKSIETVTTSSIEVDGSKQDDSDQESTDNVTNTESPNDPMKEKVDSGTTTEVQTTPQSSPQKRKYRKRRSIVYKSKPKTKPVFKPDNFPVKRSPGKRNLTIRELLQRPKFAEKNENTADLSTVAVSSAMASSQVEMNTVPKQGDATLGMLCIGELSQTFPVVTPVLAGMGGAVIPALAQVPVQTVPTMDTTLPKSQYNQEKCNMSTNVSSEDIKQLVENKSSPNKLEKSSSKKEEHTNKREFVKKSYKLKSYRCLGCPYNSLIKTNIRRHVAHHINYKPYFCDSCKTVSSDKSVIAFHVKQKHGFFEEGFSCHLVPEVEKLMDKYLEQCIVYTDKKGQTFRVNSDTPIDVNESRIRFKDCPLRTYNVFQEVIKNPSLLPTRESVNIEKKQKLGMKGGGETVKRKKASGGKNISTLLAERDAAREACQIKGEVNKRILTYGDSVREKTDLSVDSDPYQMEDTKGNTGKPTFLLVYPDKSSIAFDEKKSSKSSNFANWQMYQRKMKQMAKLNRSSVEVKRKRGRPSRNPYCVTSPGSHLTSLYVNSSKFQGNDSGILWDFEDKKTPQTNYSTQHNDSIDSGKKYSNGESKEQNQKRESFHNKKRVAPSPFNSYQDLPFPSKKRRRFSKTIDNSSLAPSGDISVDVKHDKMFIDTKTSEIVKTGTSDTDSKNIQDNGFSSSKAKIEISTGQLGEMIEVQRRGRKKKSQMEPVEEKYSEKTDVVNKIDITVESRNNKESKERNGKGFRKRKRSAADVYVSTATEACGHAVHPLSKRRKSSLAICQQTDQDSATVKRRKSPNKKWGPGGVCLCEEGHSHSSDQKYGRRNMRDQEHQSEIKNALRNRRSQLKKTVTDYYKRKYNPWQRKKTTNKPSVSSGKSLISCPFCPSQFSSINGMRRHAFWKHKMCKFQCTECDYWSTFKPDALVHFKQQHPGKTVKIHRNFSLPLDIQEDVFVPSTEVEVDDEEEDLSTPCKSKTSLHHSPTKSTGDGSFSAGSVRSVCSSSDGTQKEIEFEISHTPNQSGSGIGTCPYCGFRSTIRGVGFHLMQRHNICHYVCSKCDYRSISNIKAQRHMDRLHPDNRNSSVKKQLLWIMPDKIKSQVNSKEEEKPQVNTNVIERKEELQIGESENQVPTRSPSKAAGELLGTKVEKTKQEDVPDYTDNCKSVKSKCFYCDYESTVRGVGRHLLLRHNLCDWQCTLCPFKSSNKVKTQNHILKKHPDRKKCGLRKRFIQVKPMLSRIMDDAVEDEDSGKESPDMAPLLEEKDGNAEVPSKLSKKRQGLKKKAWALKIKSLKKKLQIPRDKEKMQQLLASTRQRNLLDINMDGDISYTLHPKKMEGLEVGFSCVYCQYAAPLRHQLRLHCYDKHTNFPACLMEFTCDIQVKTKGKMSKGGRSQKTKSKKIIHVKPSPKNLDVHLNHDCSSVVENISQNSSQIPVDISITDNTTSSEPGNEGSLICKDTRNIDSKPDSSGDKSASDSTISSLTPSFTTKKKKLRKFCNPLKPLIGQLGACKVKVNDAFHSSLDDIDTVLSGYGVRTLNMDMLTNKQFSNFMSKFGNNLQQM